jgi:hypothetical protein
MNRTMSLNYSKYVDTSSDLIKNNVSKRSLASVLIQFMNLQTKEVRTELTKTLCRVSRKLTCEYINNATRFPIVEGIDSGDLSFDIFLRAVNHTQTDLKRSNPSFSFKGFNDVTTNSYRKLPKNSDERKQMKYKGMINCCIIKNECWDSRPSTFLGIFSGKEEIPTCTMTGGTRRKRRMRSTKKYRK